jgi:hypothetical protein
MAGGPTLSFVLLERAEVPDPGAFVEAAAQLGLTATPGESSDDGPVSYEIAGGGTLLIMLVDAPHPDAERMPPGLASPEPDELERMTAHYIVTAIGLPEDPRIADPLMASLTAAVVRSSPSIAAMLGHGITFYKAPFFADIVGEAKGELPMLVCVDITMAPEPDDRMSFLTHGLTRYGREEFYVTASQRGKGALDFLLSLAAWMLDDPDKDLPTGDTVGRTAEEKVLIQRVPTPLGEGPQVIRLDLDS